MRIAYLPLLLITLLALSLISFVGPAVAADYPAPVQKAIERLAKVADVTVADIEVVSCEGVEWPDTSLGAPRPGHFYAQVITGGYKIVLLAQGRRYEYHTDMKGRVVLANSGEAQGQGETATPGSMAAKCCADLAKRLNVKREEVRIEKTEAATFLDGSLGFPRPGEVYTKAITQGQRLTLVCRDLRYLYATNDTVIRYGGPVDARQLSALYIEPIPNDPNMNGNLVQVALAGDNPRTLLTEVDSFRPQADGSIIAMRRTSRSGYDLLYLAPQQAGEGVRLARGMYFPDAAVTPDGKRWAALVRPGLGADWRFITGPAGQPADGQPIALPDGLPQQVYLTGSHPVVRMRARQGEEMAYYELVEGAFRPTEFSPPALEGLLLNRSYTLEIGTSPIDGKPTTCVARRHFSGAREVEASIPGFEVTEYSLAPGKRFVLLFGKSGEEYRAYTVDRETGEVLQTVAQPHGPVRLLAAPSARPVAMFDN
ncbi:hypothetical protein LLH23_17590 [bacterium]|nr:hypothetical protein [bacterium]